MATIDGEFQDLGGMLVASLQCLGEPLQSCPRRPPRDGALTAVRYRDWGV